jgi:cation:H+ antiporter
VSLSLKGLVLNNRATFAFKLFGPFILALGVAAPALLTIALGWRYSPLLEATFFGGAIVASAFMLGWAGEAAELDLSGGLTVGILAIVTILPEYVVSIYFAYAAGTDPSMVQYASANLTGANRLLLGFGWPLIVLVAFFAVRAVAKSRASAAGKAREKNAFGISLEPEARTDLGFLLIASILAFLVPATGQIHLVWGIAMVAIFVAYLWRQSHAEREEPELEGIAARIGSLTRGQRIFFESAVLVVSAAIILVCAEPFAHSLIEAGKSLGIDDYLLVQWLAPIASEAPEFSLALIFAARGRANLGLAILISSKVNQWTVLAGSLPIAYVVGGGQGAALPMDFRQVEEFTLTAGQTLLGIALLLGLRLGARSAILLFGLFAITFVLPQPEIRFWLAMIYLALAAVIFVVRRKLILPALTEPFRLPKKLV